MKKGREDLPVIPWAIERYGIFYVPEHKDRFHCDGFKVASGPQIRVVHGDDDVFYLDICLDPLSPIGQYVSRYYIPFMPGKDFHMDRCTFWIYKADDEHVRLEIRAPGERNDPVQDDPRKIEFIYGIVVRIADCAYLGELEESTV